jgi:mannosyltransferase OCH1-like enzyme
LNIMPIPKRIHQIWIGDSRPDKWMRTWWEKHPNWEYNLWSEEQVFNLKLRNQNIYDIYSQLGDLPAMSDILRVEILLQYGGVYIDADMECLKPLDGAEFLQSDFFATYANREDKQLIGKLGFAEKTITNSVLGTVPNHPLLELYNQRIGEIKYYRPAWWRIGAKLLTQCIAEYGEVTILPYYYFSPISPKGKPYDGQGPVYARHYWGFTKHLYGEANENRLHNPLPL